MSINITELDASPTLRNLSKEEKQAVVRLMEIAIEETIKAKAAELTAMQARIETLEAGLCRIVNGEYDNARTIDAAEKFARELLRDEK